VRDLSVRSLEVEWMDDPAVDPETFAAVLSGLAAVNSWTLARPPTLRFLARIAARKPDFTLLDVGFGHGDMLRSIRRWADRRGFAPRLVGIDLDPRSEPIARRATPADIRIEYHSGDAYALDLAPDVIVSSLVTHHMPDMEIVRFLDWMERTARLGWFVNDLHRHRIAHEGFRLLSTVMRWHPFVRHDGPLSVARAFRRVDWERLLAASAVPRGAVSIGWHVPFRLCLARYK
jgi:Methyltransferase domain